MSVNQKLTTPAPVDLATALEDVSVKLSRTKTWGGLETQASYGPNDLKEHSYEQELNEPGQFPFTRGAYPQMYRSRMWTLRNIVGYGAPEDTRDGIGKALAAGSAGINIVVDTLSQEAIDPDHPALEADVGREGCSVPCLRDMERLLAGINVTQTDVAWHSTMMVYPMVAALATKQGLPLAELQGSHMPDHLSLHLSGWGKRIMPADLAHRTTVDCLEYSALHSPKWALGMPQAYDLRERGCTPADEIALGMAIVNATLEDLSKRGLSVDQVAPSLAWVSATDMDIFEEVAKFRALRRIWARSMKDRHGAQDKRSMRLRIACHTSGRALVYQQPLNNLSRAAVQTLAALWGGVQSVETCTWDEPVGIPSHETRELATRTQQILAHEVGAARTADPLGGSYYVESLTNTIEAEALKRLGDIEAKGLIESIEAGDIEAMLDDYNYQIQSELDAGDRIQVGVNRFVPENEPQPPRFKFDDSHIQQHIRCFKAMKRERDNVNLKERMQTLYTAARDGQNPHDAMIHALIADASIAEVWGTVRMANGYPYDPFATLECPFSYV